MTTWVTFAPSFVWIFAGAPYLERLIADRRLAGALAGITAAVCGVVATLAVTFALHVLFAEVGTLPLGPATLPWPRLASIRPDALALAVLAAVLLFRFHLGVVWTVAAAGLAGLGLTLAGRASGL